MNSTTFTGRALAAGIAMVATALLTPMAGADTSEVIDKSAKMSATGRVTVDNIAGRVDIKGWTKASVELTGRLSDRVERLDFESDGTNVNIEVIYKKSKKKHHWGWNNDDGTTLNLKVPQNSRLFVGTVSAEISIADHLGPQDVRSVSGNINAQVGHKDADIQSVSGDIRLRGRDRSIELNVDSVSGDIEVRDFTGDIDAEAVSGDIQIRRSRVTDVSIEAVSGDIDFDAQLESGGDLEIETVSGDVTLRFDGKVSAQIQINSHSGRIDDFYGASAERLNRYGPGRRLRTTVGSGDSDIDIQTLSGDVENRTRR